AELMACKCFRTLLSLAAVAIASIGCDVEDVSIWVEPGSTAENLVFRVSTERGGETPAAPSFVLITRCGAPLADSTRIWDIGRNIETTDYITEIRYGTVPPGYTETTAPKPLEPGCYLVTYATPGQGTYFVVTEDGRVLEISRDEAYARAGPGPPGG